MTTFAADGPSRPSHPAQGRSRDDDSIKASLDVLEELLDEAVAGPSAGDWMFNGDYFATVGVELRRLHARLRIHHAASFVIASDEPAGPLPPELNRDVSRLRAEHPVILGLLDRLIRSADSVADRPLEDKEVFVMRTRELIAILRRHEAEEDRLFYLAVWRDTGGES